MVVVVIIVEVVMVVVVMMGDAEVLEAVEAGGV